LSFRVLSRSARLFSFRADIFLGWFVHTETSWENPQVPTGTSRSSFLPLAFPSPSSFPILTSPFFPSPPPSLSVRHSVLKAFGVPDIPPKRPVVTYISRQGGRRSLRDEDHDALVAGLNAAGEEHGWEIVVARMQYMSKKEQVVLSARTTVMIGVHGSECWGFSLDLVGMFLG